MTQRLGSFRTVLADRNLRRVELAFLGFNMTEFATWIAILVYAFERGGAAEMGAVSAILLVPSPVVAPFAAVRSPGVGVSDGSSEFCAGRVKVMLMEAIVAAV